MRRALPLFILPFLACSAPPSGPTEHVRSSLGADNGLGRNGLGRNGLGRNGLGRNGLGRNGLGRNGLQRADGVPLGVVDVYDVPAPTAPPHPWAYASPPPVPPEEPEPSPSPSSEPEPSPSPSYEPSPSPSPSASAEPSPSPSPDAPPAPDLDEVRPVAPLEGEAADPVADPVRADFDAWFGADVNLGSTVMKYVSQCLCPASKGLQKTWGGVDYRWPGALGLAPEACVGDAPFDARTTRILSACLGASINPKRRSVAVSFRTTEVGAPELAAVEDTLNTGVPNGEWRLEGAFFGNMSAVPEEHDAPFPMASSDERVYACQGTGAQPRQVAGWIRDFDGAPRSGVTPRTRIPNYPVLETSRTCAWGWDGSAEYPCAPIINVGRCVDVCARTDVNGAFDGCEINGRKYFGSEVVTTYVALTDIALWGDGHCSGVDIGEGELDCGDDAVDLAELQGDAFRAEGGWSRPASFCGDGRCDAQTEDASSCEIDCTTCEDIMRPEHLTVSPAAGAVVSSAPQSGEVEFAVEGFELDRGCAWPISLAAPAEWLDVELFKRPGVARARWSAAANDTCASRSATIRLTTPDGRFTLRESTVWQGPMQNRLEGHEAVAGVVTIDVPAAGVDRYDIQVRSCGAWSASNVTRRRSEWLSFKSATTAVGDGVLTFGVAPNDTGLSRVTTLAVAGYSVQVRQLAR